MSGLKLLPGVKRFGKEDAGQDLVEYSLLMAFIALCVVGLLSGMKTNTSAIWSTINVGLSSARTAAS